MLLSTMTNKINSISWSLVTRDRYKQKFVGPSPQKNLMGKEIPFREQIEVPVALTAFERLINTFFYEIICILGTNFGP